MNFDTLSQTRNKNQGINLSLTPITYSDLVASTNSSDFSELNLSNRSTFNNVSSDSIIATSTTTPKPDLVIQNASAPTSAVAASTIQLNYQVKNQGNGSAGYSYTKFYLSKDGSISSDDVFLDYDFVTSIAGSGVSSESYSLSLSSSIAVGKYYLLFQADGYGYVAESNETNNVVAKSISITAAPKPDLVIQNASAPTSAAAGSTIQLSYQVKNQGNGSAGYNYTKFYLSKDGSISSDDVFLDYDFVTSIAGSGVSSESYSLSLSSSIAVGKYYLLFQADGYGYVAESNETNNVVAKSISITAAPKPDLVIQNASAPTSAAAGSTIQLSYQVKNQGNGSAGYNYTKFYLSKDGSISSDDVFLDYDFVTSIAGSGVSSESYSLSLSSSIAVGKYYLLFQADGYGYVAESNETNNVVAKSISITAPPKGYNSTSGYGLINAAAAVAKAIGQNTFADVPDLGGNDWGADLVKAPEVWAKGYTGQGIIVAVLDTGVDYNHADLKANIWKNSKEIAGNGKDDDGNGYIDDVYGWNFDGNNNNTLDVQSHGTHVAGTIAGVKNNFGVTGIAYNAKIMPVKVLSDSGSGTISAIANGIRYAANNGARVINLSLGGSSGSSDLQSAIQYAASKGAIVVMAAGNDGGSVPIFPAQYATQWGLAVGAVDKYKNMAYFSNRAGTTPLAYVTAPGVDVYSTIPNNQYAYYSGTSMATPHVAGVIALMLSAKSSLTDAQVRQIVTQTAGNSLQTAISSLSAGLATDKQSINFSFITSSNNQTKAESSSLSTNSTTENYDGFVNSNLWSEFSRYYQNYLASNSISNDADTDAESIVTKRKKLLEQYQEWLVNFG